MGNYTREEILQMVEEEDVEFIRLQFTDMFGAIKNIAVTTRELPRALANQCMINDVSDVTPAVQDRLKLIQNTVSRLIVDLIIKKIILYILTAGDQICDIFHVVYVGINVLVHLFDDRVRIFRRILKNRRIGKSHGNTGHNHNRTENQKSNRCKNNALNAFELSYDYSCKSFFVHLRFSLAYSVGVHPVIFLNEIPK